MLHLHEQGVRVDGGPPKSVDNKWIKMVLLTKLPLTIVLEGFKVYYFIFFFFGGGAGIYIYTVYIYNYIYVK